MKRSFQLRGGRSALSHLLQPIVYQAGNVILGIPTGVIAARVLGASQRGELAIFAAGAFLLSTIVGVCSHESLPFLVRSNRPAGHTIGTAIVLQVGLGALAAVISFALPFTPGLSATTAEAISSTQPYFAMACVAFATSRAIAYAVLAQSGATSYIRIETVRAAAYLVFLSVFLIGFKWGLAGALSAFLMALAVQIGDARVELARTTTILGWDRRVAKEQVRFGLRALPGRIAGYLFTRGGSALIISLATGPAGVGYYVVAYSVSEITLMPATAASLVVQGGTTRHLSTRAVLAAAATLTISMALTFVLIGPWLVKLVFGNEFAASGSILRWLMASVPALLVVRVVTAWNTRQGFPQRTSWALGLGAILLIITVPLCGRALGLNAAVGALVFSVWIKCALLLVLHSRATPTASYSPEKSLPG